MKIKMTEAEQLAADHMPGNDELFALMQKLMHIPNPELVAENSALLEHWREAAARAKALYTLASEGHTFDFSLRDFVVGFPRMAFRIEFARRVILNLGGDLKID